MSQIPYRILATFGYNYKGFNSQKTEVIYLCPECIRRKGSPDKSGHLYVNLRTCKFHCVRCEYSGQISENLKLSDALKYDEEKEKQLEEIIKEVDQVVSPESYEYPLKIPINKVTSNHLATEYLLNRGFTLSQMEYYDMRVGNLNQEFGRIIIPNKIKNEVYTDMYSARTYIGQVPKYHNPVGIRKSEVVFNLHRIKPGKPIILVEGVLTAIAAGYNAVASLGKMLSRSQASQIMKKQPSIIYINYDKGAEEELRNACKLLYQINPSIPIMQVFMDTEADAADLSHEAYTKYLANAVPYRPGLKEIEDYLSG